MYVKPKYIILGRKKLIAQKQGGTYEGADIRQSTEYDCSFAEV